MARNKKVEILSNDKEVLHPMTDGDCVIFEDGQTLAQKLSEDDSVKYTPEIVNSSPMFKVGEGNTVDYSDNVLDGAYERATLQGQTYVNYIQESSADEVTLPTPFTEYERTQHNTLTSDEEGVLGINLVGQSYVNALQHDSEEEFVVLGEGLEFQEKKVEYTNEGQIKSAMLKGQTLVNLDFNGSTIGTLSTSLWSKENSYHIANKPTDKTCGRTFTKRGGDFTQGEKILIVIDNQGDHLNLYGRQNYYGIGITFPQGLTKRVFTIPENCVPGLVIGRLDNIEANIKFRVMFLEYQEGMENWDIPFFEGMQSVTVSMKLENLCHRHNKNSITKTGKTFTVLDYSTRTIDIFNSEQAATVFKPNTKYLIQFTISNLVLDGIESIPLLFSNSNISTGNSLFGDASQYNVSQNGVHRIIRTTTHLIGTSNCLIKALASEWESSGSTLRSLTISNIMYVEYQNGMENWDLPYFEDYQVMKPVQVESVNKNLFDINKATENSSLIWGNGKTTIEQGSYVSDFIKVEKGRTYYLSGTSIRTSNTQVFGYDKNKNYIKSFNGQGIESAAGTPGGLNVSTFSVVDSYYIRFSTRNINNIVPTPDVIQLEESSTATEYVPHQSKTTYSWDEVILRKIGDVEDTLDLTTGEWVQRIGEVLLDGNSENWVVGSYTEIPFHIQGELPNNCIDEINSTKILSSYNKQIFQNSSYGSVSATSYYRIRGIVFCPPEDITTREQAIEYIQANPIKVQYVLNTPIVHKVNLSRPNLQVYDDITHVHTKCLDGTLIPNIYLPSDVSYPAILEPNTTYNVCVNHTEVNADNPLKVNVGGTEITMTDSRKTLTTPTTLAHSNVLFTGKGNKIKESMLIKATNLLTGDLPHFNGIGSVQLGKTIENLCGSKYIKSGGGGGQINESADTIQVTITTKGSYVLEFPILKPLENGKTYFCYAPIQGTFVIYSFVTRYDNVKDYLKQPNSHTGITNPTHYIVNIDQKENQYASFCMGSHGNREVGETFSFTRPIICEYEQGMENWDWESIGYFTGTKNIGNEFMRVQNKNLFDGIIERGTIDVDTGVLKPYNGEIRTKNFIKVQPDSTITVSRSLTTSTTAYRWYDKDKNYLSITSGTIAPPRTSATCVVPKNAHYLKLKDMCVDANGLGDLSQTYQIEESSTATTYTAHKHNGLYITKDQPIELTWEQGQVLISSFGDSYTSVINNTLTTCVRNKGLLNLKPNTTYRVSFGGKTHFKYNIGCFDNNDCAVSPIFGISTAWIENTDTIFTTTKDMHKIAINVSKINDAPITPSQINHVRLEEVTEVQLRYCSGRHDELDITRGVYTQKVGMIYLDGTNTYSRFLQKIGDSFQPTDTTLITFDIKCPGAILKADVLCNRFPPRDGGIQSTDISFESACIHSTNESCRMTIKKSKASTLEEFKAWLVDNPLTILYPLATPIVHKVHIGNKNEANTEVTKPNDVFTLPTLYTEQTHIDLTNNGIVPKVQSRDCIAYPVLPMIGRTYTLQHNLTGGVSNLTADLLGRTQSVSYQNHKSLVYTPETMDAILHNELRISGKGKISRVTYIDGGYMNRDIPYIEGMKNAVNPIVKNTGKNLVQKIDSIWFFYGNTINTGGKEFNCGIAPVKPYAQYIVNKDSVLCFYDENGKCTNSPFQYFYANSPRTAPSGSKYMLVRHEGGDNATYLDGLQVVEYGQEFDNQEYKENICYVDCGEIRLTPDMFEQGSINNSGDSYESDKNTAKNRIRTKELIKLEPSVQYVILGDDSVYKYSAHFYDKDGMQVKGGTGSYDLSWKANKPFTAPSDAPMVAFFVAYQDNRNFTVDDADFNFQLVKVSEIKQLRSLPNGVHDEIDLETGEYVQRVGEIVFNGDTKFDDWGERGENGLTFNYYDPQVKQLENEKVSVFADTLLGTNLTTTWGGTPYTVAQADNGNYLQICLNKNDLRENTRDGINDYFLQNPVTVQYELATPIVKDIVIHNYPHSYEGGHVIIENGDPNTPIPAQLTYRAVTNRSGQIQQHTEQVEKQEREINELETLVLENIRLGQNRTQQYSTNLSTISLDVEEEE